MLDRTATVLLQLAPFEQTNAPISLLEIFGRMKPTPDCLTLFAWVAVLPHLKTGGPSRYAIASETPVTKHQRKLNNPQHMQLPSS